jgi:predicted transcriptional regulator
MTARRSKLEQYVRTLQVLSSNGPINLTRLTTKTKVNSNPLRDILRDLIEKELVVGQERCKTTFYSTTPKARKVLLRFRELAEMLPSVLANPYLFAGEGIF